MIGGGGVVAGGGVMVGWGVMTGEGGVVHVVGRLFAFSSGPKEEWMLRTSWYSAGVSIRYWEG